jgi:hypothetical protein
VAVKRTNSISSAISNLDRRIKTVESGTVSTSASTITTTAAPDDENAVGGVGSTGAQPPYSYRRVTRAYIYGSKVTGNTPRLELYFSEDPEIAPTDYVRLQGLHGTSTDNFELSPKSFRVFAIDTLPWDDDVRVTQPWRNTPSTGTNGETVTNTVWFNPVVEVPSSYSASSGRELITTRRIDSVSATGSTVTVTLNSTHLFEVGDVISVDLEAPLYGVDGLFRVSQVVSSTVIRYELDSPLASSLSLSGTGLGTKYVYPVAQRFVEEGTIWTDTSVEPNRVYVWKEYRWYDTADPIGDVAATQDGIAPSPVTNLEVTTEVPSGAGAPTISMTWTAPTTRSNGASISGFLDGYDIWYKKSTDIVWKREFVKDAGEGLTSHTLRDAGLVQNVTYNIRVYVVDIMAQYSSAATDNVLTATYSEVLNPPSKPTVASRLGTIKITWDGEDSAGDLPVEGVLYIEFHASTTSGFTPSEATLVGTAPSVLGGNYIVLSDLTYGQNYYFKTIFVRRINAFELESSDPSVQSDAIQVAPLVNTDVIANTISGVAIQSGTITASDKIIGNTITGALIQALTIEAGNIKSNAIIADKLDAGAVSGVLIRGDVIKTANTGTRVELSNTGIYAYNGSTPVFSFNTANATLTIGGYATTDTTNTLTSNLDGKVSGTLVGGVWNTTITGDSITSGTITGITIKTDVTSNTRTEINKNDIKFFIGGVTTEVATVRGFQSSVYDYLTNSFVNTGALAFTADAVTISGSLYGSYASMTQVSANNIYAAGRFSVDDIRRYTSNGQLTFTTTAGTVKMYVDTSQTTTAGVVLQVNGSIRFTGTSAQGSTRRIKANIQPYSFDYDSLLDLQVVEYNLDLAKAIPDGQGLGELEVGLIAEDVHDAGFTRLVSYDEIEGSSLPAALDYSKIGVLLLPIVKDLKREIEDLKNRLDNL